MIAEVPAAVFYLDDLGSAFSEIDLQRKALTLRLFRTREEALSARDVLSIFFGIESKAVRRRLKDVLKSARESANDHIRVVLCEFDATGELIEAETLLDPRATVN